MVIISKETDCLKFQNQLKKWAAFALLPLMLFSLASCIKNETANLTPSVINPLFVSSNLAKTSLQSGNLYYDNFLSSDGTSLYFQSVNGKSLVKSDYNGENTVVLSNQFPSCINVIDNMIYYVEGAKSGKVYKMDINGQGGTLVIDKNVESLIVTTDYMFFINTQDGFAYCALHDGSEITLLLNKPTTKLQLVNDKLYFQVAGEADGIYWFSLRNLKTISSPTPEQNLISDVDAPSAAASMLSSEDPSSDGGQPSYADSEDGTSSIPTPEVTKVLPRSDILFKQLTKTDIEWSSTNIKNDRFYFIDKSNNSWIMISEGDSAGVFLKKSVDLPFIVSDEYLFYIDEKDEFRIYRVSLSNSSDVKMVVNDRVAEFVVCGNSIYYRREGNLDIFRTPIYGGLSKKIT